MTLSYLLLNKFVNKIKKLIIILFSIIIIIAFLSPYAVNIYVARKFDNLIKLANNITPGIKITSNFKLKYLSSVLITKIQLANNAFFDSAINRAAKIDYTPHNLITFQHEIKYSPHKKLLAIINTTVIDGLPKLVQQNQNLKLTTTIDLKGQIKTVLNNININYPINPSENNYLVTQKMSMFMDLNHDGNNFNLDFTVPKLIYTENHHKAEIDNLQLHLRVQDFDNLNPNNRKIKLFTEIDRLYIIEKSRPLLRLANFNMEQDLGKKLSSNLSFLRLNILENKFGPLATKWQLNNVNLSTLIKNFSHFKLPITREQLDSYKFVEIGNTFLKNQPNLSMDLLLRIGNDKLKILSDVMVDTRNMDWFTNQDILDSLSASVVASIPKAVLIDLVTFAVYEQQKNISKKLKKTQQELDNLVLEKIAYLIRNNIIKEHEDNFSLDLSIAEGTFYSRMNPFKIFSF